MIANNLSMNIPTSIAPKGRVLCVDDEPSILRALSWLLQKEFEVITADNGREALDLAAASEFDVVLSDQRMPGMSGVDFLREMRSLSPRTTRILLTGYSDLQAVLRSVNESEIFRYITKPWNVGELPKVVAQAAEMARSKPLSPPTLVSGKDQARILVLDDDPTVFEAIRHQAEGRAQIIRAENLADAIGELQNPVQVIFSASRIGSTDLTGLICALRQRNPDTLSIVLAEDSGTDMVARLVNQGQIYRILPKPIEAGSLARAVDDALAQSARNLHGEDSTTAASPRECGLPGMAHQPLKEAYDGEAAPSTPGNRESIGTLFRRMFTPQQPH